ncbi:MAG: MBL fold metallo-hydrolase, partial [Deltaproteobacteria bacterium]|nr:MBL fold metallo-hydrolase [Deltaproteobacteria bacterium]
VILGCKQTKEALVIDPGDEAAKILSEIDKENLKVKYIIHTHAHFDHIGGTGEIHKKLAVPTCLHKSDLPLYENLPNQGSSFGMSFDSAPPIEKFLQDEEILEFGNHKLQVLHTPGHSPGSICFKLMGGPEYLFSGDTLFKESIGRSDFWGGDHHTLIQSIKNRLLVFSSETKVFPGHGPATEIGHEKKHNPFL